MRLFVGRSSAPPGVTGLRAASKISCQNFRAAKNSCRKKFVDLNRDLREKRQSGKAVQEARAETAPGFLLGALGIGGGMRAGLKPASTSRTAVYHRRKTCLLRYAPTVTW
jgi:hypothetical protein